MTTEDDVWKQIKDKMNKPSSGGFSMGGSKKTGSSSGQMTLGGLLNKESDSPFSFSKLMEKKKDKGNKKTKVNAWFILGIIIFVGSMFLPTLYGMLPIGPPPQWIAGIMSAAGIALIVFGAIATAISPKDMKKKYWMFVNKIRLSRGKSYKCTNCGHDDFFESTAGNTCKKCKQVVVYESED